MATFKFCLAIFLLFVNAGFTFGNDVHADSSGSEDIDYVRMEAIPSTQVVHLKWEVESEVNGAFFVIDKSIDGMTWIEKGRRVSIGNHEVYHTYLESLINFPESAVEYFRLRRIDSNGEEQILDISVIHHEVLSRPKLIPDPKDVNAKVTLTYESLLDGFVNVSIINQEGESFFSKKYFATNGYNRIELSLAGLAEGQYLVVIKDEFENKVSKTLIIHPETKKKRNK